MQSAGTGRRSSARSSACVPDLDDAALIHDDDLVGVENVARRWAMMNAVRPAQQVRAPPGRATSLAAVERAGGFVEDDERRILADSAGDGDALPLALAERAPLADQRGVPLGSEQTQS